MLHGVLNSSLSGITGFVSTKPSLSAFIPSCVFDLDATLVPSYGGAGQTWANLVPAPADGSAKTAYDFYLGRTSSPSTDDPTFTGSAGSPSAYFLSDGSDCFQIPVNTQFLKNLQKTTGGTPHTLALAFRAGPVGTSYTLMATNAASTLVGARVSVNTSGLVQLFYRGDTAAAASPSGALPALVEGTNYLYVATVDPATGAIKQWLNSLTGVSGTVVFNSCTSDASGLLTVLSSSNGSSPAPNGTRVYAASVFNAVLSDAQISALFSAYNTRHGRAYA